MHFQDYKILPLTRLREVTATTMKDNKELSGCIT